MMTAEKKIRIDGLDFDPVKEIPSSELVGTVGEKLTKLAKADGAGTWRYFRTAMQDDDFYLALSDADPTLFVCVDWGDGKTLLQVTATSVERALKKFVSGADDVRAYRKPSSAGTGATSATPAPAPAAAPAPA